MPIDFTNCETRNKVYNGASGGKRAILYNNELYMLKFPPLAKKNKEMSYSNGCISEYLGSHIFSMLGFEAQETILGTFIVNGKEKIVVACKDFVEPGWELVDFAGMQNYVATTDDSIKGNNVELKDILYTIRNQEQFNPKDLEEFFWDMFIVDAFIGNWDRHCGNWGFLYNQNTDDIQVAPIYDCGSSLFPQADEKIMEKTLESDEELKLRVYTMPWCAFRKEGRKISYYDYISSLEDSNCNQALKRVVPQINLGRIYNLIDNTEYLSKLQKEFYKTILTARKEVILDKSLEKLLHREREYER